MFTSNNTTEREWKVACADNGSILNFDDISFLDKPFFKKRGLSGTVCFRINPGELLNHESAQLQMAGNDAKYGIMPSQINEAYTRAREMGATRFGMHMMVCSNDLDYRNLVTTIRLLAELVEDLKQETGIEVSFINMGGGIGIPYEPSQRSFEIRTLFEEMWNIQNEFEERNGYSLEMYMESGRYITGPHGVLLNRAINRKKIFQEHIGVPVGMAGNPRPAVYDVYHHITVHDGKTGVRKHNRNKILKFIVNIVGPICENCDRLATLISLPRIFCDEKCGDFIVCHDTGAHSIAMAGNYNGRPRPGVWMIMMDETVQMVMYPETIEDLLARTKGL